MPHYAQPNTPPHNVPTTDEAPPWLPGLIRVAPLGVMVVVAIRDENNDVLDFEVAWFNERAWQLRTPGNPLYRVGARLFESIPRFRTTHHDRLLHLLATGDSFSEDYQSNNRYFRSTYVRFNDGYAVYYDENTALSTANSLQRILDSTPAAIMFFRAIREEVGGQEQIVDFEWVMVNRRAVAITGLSAEQLVGHRLLVVHPHNRELGLFDAYVEVVEVDKPYHAEVNYTQDGVNGWFAITAVRHDDGMIMHILDITDRKHSELAVEQQSKQLQQVNRDLRQMNENLQQFAYSSSHDLQEPLRKIQTFAQLLKTNYAGTLGESTDLVDRMYTAAERMSVLVRDLLMFSRLGTLSQDFRPVDLNRVAAEVIRLRQRQIEQLGARISVGTLPVVRGDKAQLVQLVDSLLSNALKFQPAGQAPCIDIDVQPTEPSDFADPQQAVELASFSCIRFSDNGIGFEAKYADRIFQMFQRLHPRNSPYGGTGVGLAVARRVVENHGGLITAQPRIERSGSVFLIYLPVVEEKLNV